MQEYIVRVFNDECSYYGRWRNNDFAIGDVRAQQLKIWLALNVANGHGFEVSRVVEPRTEYNPPPGLLMHDFMDYKVRLSAETGYGGDVWFRLGGLKENVNFDALKSFFFDIVNQRGERIKTIKKIEGRPVRF